MESKHFFQFNSKVIFNQIGMSIVIISLMNLLGCKSNPKLEERSLLIKNGTIINYDESFQADILIKGEKIIEIGIGIEADKNTKMIDASGLEVLPGGIDPHVHITGPFADDFTSGSKAALAGGITTIGEMMFPNIGQRITDRIEEVLSEVDSTSIVDVMIHPVFLSASIENQELIPKLAQEGYTSLKIFMIMDAFNNDVVGYSKLIELSKREGVLPMIHCEDFELLKQAQDSLISEGKTSNYYYAESRPIEAEVKATQWAIQQSESLKAPIYIVHLSSTEALDICRNAKKRGIPVYVETRPIYLYYTANKYKEEDGPLYTGMPPLRSKKDIEALWKGLADGSIHTIGSDHAPWTKAQKLNPENTILNPLPGVSNLQLMLPMLYSEGVMKNRLTIEKFVAVTSTNAAKLFGLFPRKGIIAEGSDADVVIWDKREKKFIDSNFGFSKAGFTIYNGFEVTGWPKYVLRRGSLIMENGILTNNPDKAVNLKRKKWQPFISEMN